MGLKLINRICPNCGNGNYMRLLDFKNVGRLDVKCINCNRYYNYAELCKKEVESQMNVVNKTSLQPCPFCGSDDVELRKGIVMNGAVHCNNCTADVIFDAVRLVCEGDYNWKDAVTNGWNRRANGG